MLGLDQCLSDSEVDVITLSQCETDRQTGINSDRSAVSDIEIAAAEIAGDGSSFFFGQIAWAFVGPECRR